MTSKLSRKPCQVDVKIDSNLDNEVSVVSTFIVAGVDGSIDNVGIDSSADIHFSGVGCELGVVHVSVDVEVGGNIDDVGIDGSPGIRVNRVGCELSVGGNLVVRDNSVGGHVVAAIFGVCSMKDFSSLFSTTPSKLDKDVELDILVL